ncbi:hypothetical protein SAMN05421837_107681 [Amycolatopsis pretoriensis]|uniref:Pyrrolidone-carboxylate peptidase (N-terminal pyroglutamyl peptidase) n=1 Tax=Amycolatopsis pretoriensis TaxID=218821 RepID=A0A1H5R9C8_9PSEU|nr:hypothetical protein [Amycolatopsis pretoriensis]SEF34993.1 hypothetical protein SAMN05421837_107681 [Amycolatopsis pretoriensis]
MRLTALLPLLAALPLIALPGVATAAPGCFDPAVPLTVEEQRLTATLPSGGPAVGPELVRLAGLDPLVADVKHDLCAARTPRRAERVVTQAGDRLWRTAVDRAQGRRPDLGTLDRFDDRPLYWARLQLCSAIRQLASFPSRRDSLLTAFDRGSRGLDDVRFPLGKTRRVLVSGFDPFQLDGSGITISNPAGASALQLDGRVLDTAAGPAVVQAVSFPVVWGYFDEGIVEAAYGTALRDRARRPDVVMTISQGRPGRFDVERWAGAWRGGFPDNNNVSVTGGVPPAAGWPQPDVQFIETTLPYPRMLTVTGAYPVNFNQAFCVWPAQPGVGTPVCRSDAPAPGEIAASGGGGDYLSNESMFRANRVRLGLGLTSVAGGHLHTPVLGQPTGLTDPAFEGRRQAIAAEVIDLAAAAAGGTSPAVPLPVKESAQAAMDALPGTVLGR